MFRSLGSNLVDPNLTNSLESSLQASDASEATMVGAAAFIESVFADPLAQSRSSRAATPGMVGSPQKLPSHPSRPTSSSSSSPRTTTTTPHSPKSIRLVDEATQLHHILKSYPAYTSPSPSSSATPQRAGDNRRYMSPTKATAEKKVTKSEKGDHANGARRLQMPTSLPTTPDVSSVNVSADPAAEYAVVLSMYEVYNDRIFDLLTPPVKSNATKELRRRPLVFKSTEASPDRTVVAGLRQVICGSLNEALVVLEAGLHERRVAGTGANSVSSRSHGFICVEVKKRARGRRGGGWGGNALTVVDLAGSERARDAKTQGTTLAEAGKINESLMYLGQCLQMQSGSGHSNKVRKLFPSPNMSPFLEDEASFIVKMETNRSCQPNIVPFRQCKLTELLFTNSFPSSSSHRRNPQRAVMIVTADPLGDFNATSQILRYSALAREVTVPRIPSIFSKDHPAPAAPSHSNGHHPHHQHHQHAAAPGAYPTSPVMSRDRGYFSGSGPGSGSHRNISPGSSVDDRATMELAALEIARLTEEIEALRAEAAAEAEARAVAEAHLLSLEDRMVELEEVIREDCAAEFEKRLALEVSRWKAMLAAEVERAGDHWDRKVELLERGLVGVEAEEDNNKENVLVEGVEEEMERLRRENAVLRRELGNRSPSRRVPLQEREDVLKDGGLEGRMERLKVSGEAKRSGSPKKVRRLPAKRWEDAGEDDV